MSILLDALKNAALEKKKRDALLSVNEPTTDENAQAEFDDTQSNEASINSFLSEQESISKQNSTQNKLDQLNHSGMIKDQFLNKMGSHPSPVLPNDITDQDFEMPEKIQTASASSVLNEPLNDQPDLTVNEADITDSDATALQLETTNIDLDDQLELNEEFSQLLDQTHNNEANVLEKAEQDDTLSEINSIDPTKKMEKLEQTSQKTSIQDDEALLSINHLDTTVELEVEVKETTTPEPQEENRKPEQQVKAPINDNQPIIDEPSNNKETNKETNPEKNKPEINYIPSTPTNEDFKNERKQQSIADQENQKNAFVNIKKKNITKARNKKIQLISMYALGITGLISFTGYQYYLKASTDLVTPVIVVPQTVQNTTKQLLNENSIESTLVSSEVKNNVSQQATDINDVASNITSDKVLDLTTANTTTSPTPSTTSKKATDFVKKESIKSIPKPESTPIKKAVSTEPVKKIKADVKANATPSQAQTLSVKEPSISAYQEAIYSAYRFYQMGNFDIAKQHYLTAMAFEPTSIDAQFGLAGIAMAQHDYAKAIDFYQQRINIQPNDAQALSGMILAASKFENINKLKAQLNEILFHNPKASHLHFIQGTLHARQQNWVDAQASFFTAWQYSPDKAVYAFNLAISLEQLNLPKQALSFYQQAKELDDQSKHFIDRVILNNRINQLVKTYE